MPSISDIMQGVGVIHTEVPVTVPNVWIQLLPCDIRRIGVYFTVQSAWGTVSILPSPSGPPAVDPAVAGAGQVIKLSWQWALDGPTVTQQFWAASPGFGPGDLMLIMELWQYTEGERLAGNPILPPPPPLQLTSGFQQQIAGLLTEGQQEVEQHQPVPGGFKMTGTGAAR